MCSFSKGCHSDVFAGRHTGLDSSGMQFNSREHHYVLTIETEQYVVFDACNSTFDTVLHVYDYNSSTELFYRDDGGCVL